MEEKNQTMATISEEDLDNIIGGTKYAKEFYYNKDKKAIMKEKAKKALFKAGIAVAAVGTAALPVITTAAIIVGKIFSKSDDSNETLTVHENDQYRGKDEIEDSANNPLFEG